MPPKNENPINENDIYEAQIHVGDALDIVSDNVRPEDRTIDQYNHILELLNAGSLHRKESPEDQDKLTTVIDFYNYFKTQHGCVTIGEALGVLERGEVNTETVEMWINEGLAVDPMEYNAISIGYPDLRSALKSAKDKAMAKYL